MSTDHFLSLLHRESQFLEGGVAASMSVGSTYALTGTQLKPTGSNLPIRGLLKSLGVSFDTGVSGATAVTWYLSSDGAGTKALTPEITTTLQVPPNGSLVRSAVALMDVFAPSAVYVHVKHDGSGSVVMSPTVTFQPRT